MGAFGKFASQSRNAAKRVLVRDEIEGYDHPDLVETILQKTLVYQATGAWPLVVGKRTVLDFGGGCGVHYKLAQRQNYGIRWAVVETPAMVARAKELETDRLRFFTDIIAAAAWLGPIDLMHSNGAIQYVLDPMETIWEVCALEAKMMFWDRVHLTATPAMPEVQVSFLGDNGPGQPTPPRARVRYVRTPILLADFLAAHDGYTAERDGERFIFVRNH